MKKLEVVSQSHTSVRIEEELDCNNGHEDADMNTDAISGNVHTDLLLTSCVKIEGVSLPEVEVQTIEVKLKVEETLHNHDPESDSHSNAEKGLIDITGETGTEEGVLSMSSNGSILVSTAHAVVKQVVRHAFVKKSAHVANNAPHLDSEIEAAESAVLYVPLVKTVARSWVVPSKKIPSEHSPLTALSANSNVKNRPLPLHTNKVKLLHVQTHVKMAAPVPVKDTAESLLCRSGKLQVNKGALSPYLMDIAYP